MDLQVFIWKLYELSYNSVIRYIFYEYLFIIDSKRAKHPIMTQEKRKDKNGLFTGKRILNWLKPADLSDDEQVKMRQENVQYAIFPEICSIIMILVDVYCHGLFGNDFYFGLIKLLTLFNACIMLVLTIMNLRGEELSPSMETFLVFFMVSWMAYAVKASVIYYEEPHALFPFFFVSTWAYCLFLIQPIVQIPSSLICVIAMIHAMKSAGRPVDVSDLLSMWAVLEIVTTIRYGRAKERVTSPEAITKEYEKILSSAMTDELTGLHNRYALKLKINQYDNRSLFVVMMDIDNFKIYNDTSGHENGDRLLIRFASLLKQNFPGADIYRYGGDEFLIIDDADKTAGVEGLMKLHEDFHGVRTAGRNDRPGCSCGYIYRFNKYDSDLTAMIRDADIYLYQVKRNGKDSQLGKDDR